MVKSEITAKDEAMVGVKAAESSKPWWIGDKTMAELEKQLCMLFKKLVPFEGAADTVAGEIVRAINYLAHRFWNDGEMLGLGNGRETLNPAGRYLVLRCNLAVGEAVISLWGTYQEDEYIERLVALESAVLEYLKAHPELEDVENTEDMRVEFRDQEEDTLNEENEWELKYEHMDWGWW